MSSYGKSLDVLLGEIDLALTNAMEDAELQELLVGVGYGSTELAAGRALYNTASAAYQQQKLDYANQYTMVQTYKSDRTAANEVYKQLYKLAKIALKNDHGGFQALGLTGKRESNFEGWRAQTTLFCTGALSTNEYKEKLAKRNITEARILEFQTTLNDVFHKAALAERAKGNAQQSTLARDQAIDTLVEWFKAFIGSARVACQNSPQNLEKLGITKRSRANRSKKENGESTN